MATTRSSWDDAVRPHSAMARRHADGQWRRPASGGLGNTSISSTRRRAVIGSPARASTASRPSSAMPCGERRTSPCSGRAMSTVRRNPANTIVGSSGQCPDAVRAPRAAGGSARHLPGRQRGRRDQRGGGRRTDTVQASVNYTLAVDPSRDAYDHRCGRDGGDQADRHQLSMSRSAMPGRTRSTGWAVTTP